jgi:molecular chaperone DnaK
MKIGIDFGTTNSILSYMDGDNLETYKHGGGSAATNYIRSCVAIAKDDSNDISIGELALSKQTDSDYDVYTNFKMLLVEQGETLSQRGYKKHNPQQITKVYLDTLIQEYQDKQKVTQPITNVVITVPEVWVRQGGHAARRALMKICKTELGLPVKLYSEPVAVAVYFAHQFKRRENRAFNGHLLVCDYGGGTLDLSLCKLENEQIEVLDGVGYGQNRGDTLGKAGVAYDECVVKNFIKKHNLAQEKFHKLLFEFEKSKITHANPLPRMIDNYLRERDTDKKVFKLDDLEIRTSDMVESFNSLIKTDLEKALSEMNAKLENHKVDINNSERFRIVMAGGFSNFYPVRKTVTDFFKSATVADQRFNTLNLEDTALAISKGAALIANGAYVVTQTCPINVGIRLVNQHFKDEDVLILKKGEDLGLYRQPVYLPGNQRISVACEQRLNQNLVIFIDIGHGKRRYIDVGNKLADFLPNPSQDNSWRIGFSVDEDLLFYFHAQDVQGSIKDSDLGEKLTRQINGIHIWEE